MGGSVPGVDGLLRLLVKAGSDADLLAANLGGVEGAVAGALSFDLAEAVRLVEALHAPGAGADGALGDDSGGVPQCHRGTVADA